MTHLLIPLLHVALALPVTQHEGVSDLIAEGRRLLEQGQVAEALELFEAAAEKDGNSPAARLWVVRGWLADGRLEEALDATDELKGLGLPKADLDYLYGLSFHASALREAATGGGLYTQSQFEDATRFLIEATAADEARYGDAFGPLAESAWYATDLAVASEAAAKAVARRPDDTATLILRGRVAFSHYSAARTAEEPGDVLDRYWAETKVALDAAVAAFGTPAEEVPQFELAGVYQQLGNLHLWREDQERAAAAYAEGMAWDPRALDLNTVRTGVGDELFAASIAGARPLFAARHPAQPEHPGVPLLAWWLGFAAFELGDLPAAEAAFLEAIAANPDYSNSWYYVFRAAYSQRKYDQSLIALRAYWKQDPEGLLGTLRVERDLNLRMLEFLVSWLIDADKQVKERYREAAVLAEIMTLAVPEEPRYWNNLGLFLRDYGDQLKAAIPAPAPDELQELWELAHAAYTRTLELLPDHPAYLNDSAVVLHYYLEREYDRAEAMYLRAIDLAGEGLAGTDLSTADRIWYETALKDAGDNLEKLRKKRADAAAADAAAEPGS